MEFTHTKKGSTGSYGSAGGSYGSAGGSYGNTLGAALLERHISPSPEAPSGLAHHLETEFKEAATALAVIIREKLNVRTCFEVSARD
jgi:hypothetical protein